MRFAFALASEEESRSAMVVEGHASIVNINLLINSILRTTVVVQTIAKESSARAHCREFRVCFLLENRV